MLKAVTWARLTLQARLSRVPGGVGGTAEFSKLSESPNVWRGSSCNCLEPTALNNGAHPTALPSLLPGLSLPCAAGLGAGDKKRHVSAVLAPQTPWACRPRHTQVGKGQPVTLESQHGLTGRGCTAHRAQERRGQGVPRGLPGDGDSGSKQERRSLAVGTACLASSLPFGACSLTLVGSFCAAQSADLVPSRG